MAAVDNGGEGGHRQQWTTTACKIRQWTMKGMDKSGQQETAETQSGDDGCSGGSWRQWKSMAAEEDDGNGGQREGWTTKAADDNGTQDRAADYKGEGGERAANKNGIRQKADEPAGQRA